MASEYEQAMAKQRAGPGSRARLGGSARPSSASTSPGRTRSARSGRRAGAAVRLLALPVVDTAGLVAAAVISGMDREVKGNLPCALYVAAVLVILAAGRQHRLRICLRVSDQAGRILISTAVPALALLEWLPASRVLWLALWSGALVFIFRSILCAVLRAAHRRGLLTEPAVVVGAGTFGAYVAELMREHPEFGLRPMGLLDDGPPRRDLSVPSLGSPADLIERGPEAGDPPGHCLLLLGLPRRGHRHGDAG